MKLIGSLVLCKGFALCRGHITENDTYTYTMEDTSNNTKFSQIIYTLEGGGELYDEDGKAVRKSGPREVNDLREFYKKPYSYMAGQNGATWVCINPFPVDKFFDVKLIPGSTKSVMI